MYFCQNSKKKKKQNSILVISTLRCNEHLVAYESEEGVSKCKCQFDNLTDRNNPPKRILIGKIMQC